MYFGNRGNQMEQSRNNDASAAPSLVGDARRVGMSRRSFVSAAAASAAVAGTIGSAFGGTDKFGRDRDWTGAEPVIYPDRRGR